MPDEIFNIDLEPYYAALIEEAKEGKICSARELISDLIISLQLGNILTGMSKEYFIEAFQKILAGESADIALNMNNAQGGQYLSQEEEYKRAYTVVKHKSYGLSLEKALERSSTQLNISTSRLKVAYQKYRVEAECDLQPLIDAQNRRKQKSQDSSNIDIQ